MLGDQGFQSKPVDQIAHQLLEHHRHAGLRQVGLSPQRPTQDVEALTESGIAPVVQSGALGCGRHQHFRTQLQRGAVARECGTDWRRGRRIDRLGEVIKPDRFRANGFHEFTSPDLTTRHTGRCGVSSGRNHRNQIRPFERPAVDTQLG